jgi:hypothetical protein
MGRCLKCGKFILRKRKIRAWILCRKCIQIWLFIEEINKKENLMLDNTYIDPRGYLRWLSNDHLCHRDIAFKYNLPVPKGFAFSDCDVHHKNLNKLDDRTDNLEVLDRRSHELDHKEIINVNGITYRRLIPIKYIRHETRLAWLLPHKKWIPKSQGLFSDGFLYVTEWLYRKKQ